MILRYGGPTLALCLMSVFTTTIGQVHAAEADFVGPWLMEVAAATGYADGSPCARADVIGVGVIHRDLSLGLIAEIPRVGPFFEATSVAGERLTGIFHLTGAYNPYQAEARFQQVEALNLVKELTLTHTRVAGLERLNGGVSTPVCFNWEGDRLVDVDTATLPLVASRISHTVEFVVRAEGGWRAVDTLAFEQEFRIRTTLDLTDDQVASMYGWPPVLGYGALGVPDRDDVAYRVYSPNFVEERSDATDFWPTEERDDAVFLSGPMIISRNDRAPELTYLFVDHELIGALPDGTTIVADVLGVRQEAIISSCDIRPQIQVIHALTGDVVSYRGPVPHGGGEPRLVAGLRAPTPEQASGERYVLAIRGLQTERALSGSVEIVAGNAVYALNTVISPQAVGRDGAFMLVLQSIATGSSEIDVKISCDGQSVLDRLVEVNVRAYDLSIPGTPEGIEDDPGASVQVGTVFPLNLWNSGGRGDGPITASELIVQSGGANVAFYKDESLSEPFEVEAISGVDAYRVAAWDGGFNFTDQSRMPSTVWVRVLKASESSGDISISLGDLNWGGQDEIFGDSVHITARQADEGSDLLLEPRLITAPYDLGLGPYSEQLYLSQTGVGSDRIYVQDNANVEWAFVGMNDVPEVLQGLYELLWRTLNEHLDVDIARISIDGHGMLAVHSPGINVIAARIGGGPWSNLGLVIAGMEAVDLELRPRPPIGYAGLPELADQWLVMMPDRGTMNPIEFDYGAIDFGDLTLRFASDETGPTIKLSELVDLLRNAAEWVGEHGGRWLGGVVGGPGGIVLGQEVGGLTGEMLINIMEIGLAKWFETRLALSSTDVNVVQTVDPRTIGGFFFNASADAPGTAWITGTLDLVALGTVSDVVPAIVLSQPTLDILTAAEMSDPNRPDRNALPPIRLGGPGEAEDVALLGVGEVLLAAELSTEGTIGVTAGRFDFLWTEGNDVQLGPFDSPITVLGHEASLKGEVVTASQEGEHLSITLRDLRVEFTISNPVIALPTTRSNDWSFDGVVFDHCTDGGILPITNGSVRCDTDDGLFYDYVVSRGVGAGSAEAVRATISFDHLSIGAAVGIRDIVIEPAAPAAKLGNCSVGLPRVSPSSVGPAKGGGETITELDLPFVGTPYRDLLVRAIEWYELHSFEDPDPDALDREEPGRFGPTLLTSGSDVLEGGWTFFIEFPVNSASNCTLIVGHSTTTINDVWYQSLSEAFGPQALKTQGRWGPARSWHLVSSASYWTPVDGFEDALIYMSVPRLRVAQGEDWRVWRQVDRVTVADRTTEVFLFGIDQGTELLLEADPASISVRLLGRSSGVPASAWNPAAPDIAEVFVGVGPPPGLAP